MERKITTRITAFSAALAVIASSAVSCGKDGDKGSEKKATELLAASYHATEIETDIDIKSVNSFTKVDDDTIILSSYDSENKSLVLYKTGSDFSSFDSVNVDLGIKNDDKQDVDVFSSVGTDGTTMAIARFTDYGEAGKPDFDSPDFDYEHFDYEEYTKKLKFNYKIYCVDIDGKVVSSNDINGIDDDPEEHTSIGDVSACSGGKAIIRAYGMDEKSYIVNSDGNVEKELKLDGFDWIESFISLPDGTVAVSGSAKNGSAIKVLDGETFEQIGDDIEINDNMRGMSGIFAGNDEYKFFANTSTGLSGIADDGKTTEIVNWVDSDLSNGYVSSILPVSDEEFIILYDDNSGDGTKLYRLSKRDMSELENTNVITLGVLYDDWEINQKVSDFNKAHDDIRIKIEDYSKYNEYDDDGMTLSSGIGQLKKDIVSGKAPDMIASNNTALTRSLQSKGLFVDLYEYLDKDTDLSRDDIMPNVLKACEINGKLLSLSPSFSVDTCIAKKKFVDTPDWTVDQMIETYNKLPEGMKLNELECKEQVLMMIVYTLNECIDYDKGTCNFDTPDFRKLVDFCEKFPSQDEVIDWEDEDSYTAIYADDNYLNDKVLLSELYLYDFTDYIRETKGKFNNEPVTFVGYPSNTGHGGLLSMNSNFSILSNATDKDACWTLIKEFFKESDESDGSNYRGDFPSLKSDFYKLADESMKKPTYTDEDGKTVEEDITYNIGDKEIVLEPLTKEERDFIVDYIENTTRTAYDFDPEIESILEEELMAYMKGEKTANEVLDLLQSRVSLLVSEQS